MADSRSAEVDPRKELAQRRMAAARAELESKEAEKRPQQRRAASRSEKPSLAPSISGTVFVHAILLSLLMALVFVALVGVYVLLLMMPVAGRVVAMGTGTLVFVALGYTSVCVLGIIESTTQGRTTLEHAVQGDWRDWCFSLPTTLGMALVAAACGYVFGLPAESGRWVIFGTALLVIYPVLQLSTLENGSVFAPISVPVLRTLLFQPLAWIVFYAASVALWVPVVGVARLAWRDPPFITAAILGPIVIAALFVYSWLMGQLATWISARELQHEKE